MKKNITINLCGRLFNIDEDAYDLLKKYLDTLHNFFNRQTSGDEIVNDIEQRIAELLDEMKAQGVEAINIEHVKEVISRMGQPEEMATEESEENTNTESRFTTGETENTEQPNPTNNIKDFFKGRHFYRNPKDKMLAGVISGLATSFEMDVTILRLIVVALAIVLGALPFPFIGFWQFRVLMLFIITYLILAVIMPAAETPEEQLKMQGKPVNMSNLANEVVQNVSEKAQEIKENGSAKSIINGIMKFLTGCLKAILIILGIALFFAGIAVLVWALISIISPSTSPYFFDWRMQTILNVHAEIFGVFLGTLLASIFIPAYAIFYSLNHRMSIAQRIIWILIWLAALATAIVTGAMLDNVNSEIKHKEYMSNHTRNNVFMSDEDMEYLDMCGWEVTRNDNCNRFTTCGQHYSGNELERYLDEYNEECKQRYTVEKEMEVQPGTYQLSAVVRSQGLGPVLWARVNSPINHKKYQKEFPITGNEGGDVWKDACLATLEDLKANMSEIEAQAHWDVLQNIRNANDGKGFGWCKISIDNIQIDEPSVIKYGISTDPRTTGIPMHAKWFSACDVELTPM
ncbi:MAG: PspC domain-containing protein [Prevotella sp.]|nr:PspC domain-containing protein [Prevotella sp.]MBR5062527.1 PspC domain-containing protein [Prevotella sp.]